MDTWSAGTTPDPVVVMNTRAKYPGGLSSAVAFANAGTEYFGEIKLVF